MSKHFWLRSFALTIVRDPLRIVGQMSTEESKQKFLLECVESDQQKESDRLISGPRNTSFQRVQVFNSKLVATCCEWFDVGAWPTTLSLRSSAVVKIIGANSHDFLLRKGFELVHPIAPSLLRSSGEGCCCSVNRVVAAGQTFQLRALTSGHLVGLVQTEPDTYELQAKNLGKKHMEPLSGKPLKWKSQNFSNNVII